MTLCNFISQSRVSFALEFTNKTKNPASSQYLIFKT